MAEKTLLAKWLDNKYLNWQTDAGERKTVIEFADYLNVNRSLLSYWMNGSRKPSEKNLIKIALKLGFEVYDVLDLPRPDPDLQRLNQIWPHIPEKVRKSLREKGEQYVNENEDEKQSERKPSRKPA